MACALAASSAATTVAWLATLWELQWDGLLVACATAVSAGAAWRFWPVDTGTLAWDGNGWRWNERGGSIVVAVDAGDWMLLRFDAAGSPRRSWVGVSHTGSGGAWHGLRAAVYCRRPPDEVPTADSDLRRRAPP